MKFFLMVIIIIVGIPSIAFPEIYKWTDEKGHSHYTNKIKNVPQKKLGTKKKEPENLHVITILIPTATHKIKSIKQAVSPRNTQKKRIMIPSDPE